MSYDYELYNDSIKNVYAALRRIMWMMWPVTVNIFGIPDPDVPIRYTTFIGLRRRLGLRAVLFPLMGIEIGMEIIYFHSDSEK